MVTIGLAGPDATLLDCNVCAWKTLTGTAVYKYKYINKTWHMRHVDLITCSSAFSSMQCCSIK